MLNYLKKFFLASLSLLAAVGCYAQANYSDFGILEYTEVNEYSVLDYATLSLKISMKEDFIFVFGSSGCAHCTALKAEIEDYIDTYKQKIYYFPAELWTNLSVSQKEVVSNLVDVSKTPSVSFIIDGEVVYQFSGTKSMKEFYNLTKKYFVTGPKVLDLAEVRTKRDNKSQFVLLIARPDCGTCNEFNRQIFNKYLFKFPGKFFLFDTKPYRDPTVVTSENPTPSQDAIDLYAAIRSELQFNWTPTLVAFENGEIVSRFQWLDNNYYIRNLLFVHYEEIEFEGETYPAVPTTDDQLEGKSFSSYEQKTAAMIKHYNKAFEKWIANYYK